MALLIWLALVGLLAFGVAQALIHPLLATGVGSEFACLKYRA